MGTRAPRAGYVVEGSVSARDVVSGVGGAHDINAYRDRLCFFLVDTIGSSLSLKSLNFVESSFW